MEHSPLKTTLAIMPNQISQKNTCRMQLQKNGPVVLSLWPTCSLWNRPDFVWKMDTCPSLCKVMNTQVPSDLLVVMKGQKIKDNLTM